MVLGKSRGGLSIWYTTPGRWELLPSEADQCYKGSEQPFLVLWRNFVWLCFKTHMCHFDFQKMCLKLGLCLYAEDAISKFLGLSC